MDAEGGGRGIFDRINRMDRILSSAESAGRGILDGMNRRERIRGGFDGTDRVDRMGGIWRGIFDRMNRMDRILSSAESAGSKEEGTQRRRGRGEEDFGQDQQDLQDEMYAVVLSGKELVLLRPFRAHVSSRVDYPGRCPGLCYFALAGLLLDFGFPEAARAAGRLGYPISPLQGLCWIWGSRRQQGMLAGERSSSTPQTAWRRSRGMKNP